MQTLKELSLVADSFGNGFTVKTASDMKEADANRNVVFIGYAANSAFEIKRL